MRVLTARSEFQCLKGLMRLAIRPVGGRTGRGPGGQVSGGRRLAGPPRSASQRRAVPRGQPDRSFRGPRLSVSDITGGSRGQPRLQRACALAPGLTWSPDGDKLAFRDEDGQGRLVDLSGQVSPPAAETRMQALGAATSLAFVPGGDRLAMLVPSSAGPDDAEGHRAEPGGGLGAGAAQGPDVQATPRKGSTWPCRRTGACWRAPRGRPRSGCTMTATGQPVRQFDDHRRPSPVSAGLTTNGSSRRPWTRR